MSVVIPLALGVMVILSYTVKAPDGAQSAIWGWQRRSITTGWTSRW